MIDIELRQLKRNKEEVGESKFLVGNRNKGGEVRTG